MCLFRSPLATINVVAILPGVQLIIWQILVISSSKPTPASERSPVVSLPSVLKSLWFRNQLMINAAQNCWLLGYEHHRNEEWIHTHFAEIYFILYNWNNFNNFDWSDQLETRIECNCVPGWMALGQQREYEYALIFYKTIQFLRENKWEKLQQWKNTMNM